MKKSSAMCVHAHRYNTTPVYMLHEASISKYCGIGGMKLGLYLLNYLKIKCCKINTNSLNHKSPVTHHFLLQHCNEPVNLLQGRAVFCMIHTHTHTYIINLHLNAKLMYNNHPSEV